MENHGAGAAAKCRAPGIGFRDSVAKPEASDISHAGLRVPAPGLPAGTEGTGELTPEDRAVQLRDRDRPLVQRGAARVS